MSAPDAALEAARHLAERGVPLFLAEPARDENGDWDPTGGHHGTGYWLPGGWQLTEPDPSVVDRWRPGMALCAVMGRTVDLLDVDPHKGGDLAALNGTMPTSYGRAATPSGGTHDLVATLGVHSRDGVLPGIDVKAGTADGQGRGFGFLPPTRKRSKVDGVVRAYDWTTPPRLPDDIDRDDSGRPLAALVEARSRPSQGITLPALAGPSYADLSPGQKAMADRDLDRVVEDWAKVLDGAADWPEGECDEKGRGWEALARDAAWALAREAVAPWTRWEPEDAEEAYAEVLPEVIAANEKCRDKWRDGLLDKAAAKPLELPEWLEFGTPVEPQAGAKSFAFRQGGAFIFDTSPDPVPFWGTGNEVLWAEGEALMIAGPQGTGKTTIAQQIVLGRCGLLDGDLLGYPVRPGRGRVLYLAMDRPKQAARSMRRMVTEDMRVRLDERLEVWEGPPPRDMAKDTGLLHRMAVDAGADTVVVDSLKDAAIGLTDDEVGAGWNRARQTALAAGVEVIELHHQRKQGKKDGPPAVDDIYGSTWLTSGAGSILLLSGAPGDPIVGLSHVKQPAEPVGPLQVIHHNLTGRSEVFHAADLVALARSTSEGITAVDAARALFDADKPSANEKERARRRLERLAKGGHLELLQAGDPATKTPARWGIPGWPK